MTEEEDLEALEIGLRRAQVEWDKYFAGLERVPPERMMRELQKVVRRYAGGEIRNTGRRFRYQQLVARYNTYRELWNRRLRDLEEGRTQRGVPLRRPPSSPVPKAASGEITEFAVRNRLGDFEQVQALYDRFLDERRQAGESESVQFESFQKLIAQQTRRIIEREGSDAVAFRLENKNGRVSLKARPLDE